jgi:hypothetical protein
VRQGGRAVTGAKVCVIADMPTMEHPGLTEAGKPVVSVPVSIEVALVEQE